MLGSFLPNEGILLINKPTGMSSFAAVKAAQKALKIKKAGHAGTLDPLASGLMIIGTGRYTKLLGHLSNCDKVYEVVIRLGSTSSTDDGEGIITEQHPARQVSEQEIIAAVNSFVGPILQVPPRFSAIKVDGKRAYSLSRNDVDFELSAREVTIHSIVLEKISFPDVHLKVHCQKGTYMRSLARDIGEKLEVGGYALSIHRVAIGRYDVASASMLESITEQHLLRGIHGINDLLAIPISEEDALRLRMGKRIACPEEITATEAIAHHQEELVAVVKRVDNMLLSLRGI